MPKQLARAAWSITVFAILVAAGTTISLPVAAVDAVALPTTQIGDRYAYNVTGTRLENPTDTLQLAWEGATQRLPDGATIPTQELRYSWAIQAQAVEQADTRLIFQRGTHHLVGIASDLRDLGGGYNAPSAPLPWETNTATGDTLHTLRFTDDLSPTCLFSSLWAKEQVTARSVLTLPPCQGPLFEHDARLQLQATGWDLETGRRAMRLVGQPHPDQLVEIWLTPGLPVPYAVRWGNATDEPPFIHGVLAGFAAAQELIEPMPTGSPARLPAIQMRPAKYLLVDDADAPLPFTLTDALLGPSGLGSSPEVAVFLHEHPGAAIRTAQSWKSSINGVEMLDWNYVLQDSAAGLNVRATKALPEGTPIAAAKLVPAHVATDPIGGTSRPAPQSAPVLTDLVQAYRWFGGDAFDWYAYDQEAQIIRVGHEAGNIQTGPTAATFGFSVAFESQYAEFDLAGHLVGLQSRGKWAAITQGPDTPLSSPPPPPPLPPTSQMPTPTSWQTEVEVGAAALIVSLLVWFALGLKTSPLFGLFTRLREDRLLDHPLRRQIRDAVLAQPGIHFKQLARMTSIPNGTLIHHTRLLERPGLLTVRRTRGFTCYFPGPTTPGQLAAIAALKSRGARDILKAVRQTPGTVLSIRTVTGLNPATVHYHLGRLETAGLISRQRRGRTVHVDATPLGLAVGLEDLGSARTS